MAFETAGAGAVFLLGRLLFGGVLAFMGVNHFLQADRMSGYAGAKGVPAAGLLVPATGGLLLVGGLSVVTGAFPLVGAGALVVFLVVTTPVMHDFWNAEGEDQQSEVTAFLKNVGLLGGALVLLALSTAPWPFAAL